VETELNSTTNAMTETMLMEMDAHLNASFKMVSNAFRIQVELRFVNLNKTFVLN
jgi:hypothetical protein